MSDNSNSGKEKAPARTGKAGSDSDTAARDSAVVASIALQFGVPLDVLRHALMRDAQGRPSGPLGTALDFVAK